jgi:hypothetical protein
MAKVASKKRDETAKKIIAATHKSNGLIIDIASKAHLNRNTVTKYMNEFPAVAEAVEDAREELYDTVESKLYERIEAGDLTAIIFFLKTRCKHRGYSEKQQIEAPQEVTFRVVYDDELKQGE